MDRIWGVLLLSVLFLGCRQGAESPREAMVLCGSMGGVSKTDALTAGDEVAVFARLDGTEHYFLEAAKFTTGSDGKTLTATPAVYYPKPKQAVNFYAYFPYHTGVFSVPTDQSTASALKKADLCWTTTSTTPVPTPVSLEFQHLFARLIVQTNTSTEKIAIPNTFLGGTLDIKTGAFTNTLKSEVFTTGTELILPAQSVTRLVLTVSGVEYTFEGAILLESGKTTSINLTLNPTTHTVTLAGSSTIDWSSSAASGSTAPSAHNLLLMECSPLHPNLSTVTKVVLTAKDQVKGTTNNYTIESGISILQGSVSVPFTSLGLSYPYQITEVKAYNTAGAMLFMASSFVGAVVYKSGVYVFGAKLRNPTMPPSASDYVVINGLKWAKGNLIATDVSIPGAMNGCKVGAPTDGGLFFQFGSLIGWKGGALASGGTGEGIAPLSWARRWWNGAAAFSFANDAMVWPTVMDSNRPTAWPINQTTNKWYFGLQAGWSTAGQVINSYPGFSAGDFAADGVGDACTYYLGAPWRLPTLAEWQACIFNNAAAGGEAINYYPSLGGAWISSEPQAVAFAGGQLRFTAGNMRLGEVGSLWYDYPVWTACMSTIVDGTLAYIPQGLYAYCSPARHLLRSTGVAVRCVSN